MKNTPYTYLVGWSKLDKWYYGSQYGIKAHPDNLWKTYFTSSKSVKKLREEHGEPDIIQIRKTFNCRYKALSWEFRVLKRLKVTKTEKWLNRGYGGEKFMNASGPEHVYYGKKRPEHAALMKGENNPSYGIRRMGAENHFYGRTHSQQTKDIIIAKASRPYHEKMDKDTAARCKAEQSRFMSENNPFKGKKHSEETLQKLRGRVRSTETIEKMRKVMLAMPKKECPHCGSVNPPGQSAQWHFDKCRFKPEPT